MGTATVTISGIGTFSITDALRVFDNQSLTLAGINDATNLDDILNTDVNSAFDTYALTTAIGPLSGAAFSNRDVFFPTTGGSLLLEAVGPIPASQQ